MAPPTSIRAFASLAFAFLVVMTGTTLPTPMYTIYQERFGFSLSMSTVIFAVYAAGVLAALLLVGNWSDAWGRRPLLFAGLASAAVSGLVFLVAWDTWVLLVGRTFSGISAGIFVGTATAAVIDAAPPSWREHAPMVATAANIGGLGLGPLLAGLFVDFLPSPVHLAFAVHVAFIAVASLLVWSVPETVERQAGTRPSIQRLAVPAAARTAFIGAGIAGFAGFAVTGLLTALSPRLVAEVADTSSAVLQDIVVVVVLFSSVLAQFAGRRATTEVGVNLGCALLVVGMLIFIGGLRIESLAVMVPAAVLVGAGQGMSLSKGLASVMARVEPTERAAVGSAFFVVIYVAISLPVIGGGIAAQRWGIFPASEAFALAVAALAAIALATLVLDQRRAALSQTPH